MDISAMDLSLIAGYPGTYQQALIKQLYQNLEAAASGLSVMPGLKSTTQLTKLLTQDGLKPYTGQFVANPAFSFKPRFLTVKQAQRDFFIEPKKFIGTYLEANRGRGEHANNTTIPFAQVIFEAINQQIVDEIVREVIWYGKGRDAFNTDYSDISTYNIGDRVNFPVNDEIHFWTCTTATAAGEGPLNAPSKWQQTDARAIAPGLEWWLLDAIDAGEISGNRLVNTGAITSTDAYDQFIAIWRALPEVVRSKGATMYCSIDIADRLNDSYETKISKNFENAKGITILPKTDGKCRILPVNWLAGSEQIMATPSGNLWMGTDQLSDMNVLRTIERMYGIEYGATFMIGFQIADPAVMAINFSD